MSSWGESSIFAKLIVIFAIIFCVALGSCGLSFVVSSNQHDHWAMRFGGYALLAMILSVLGLLITVIVWGISAGVQSFRGKRSGPQKLFDDGDEKH